MKRTRKLLQDAFVELLGEKRFEAITVQDIAARSTVNRATFYAHFVDKYDLFAQFSREWFRGAVERQLPPAARFNTDNVRQLVLATMQALADMNDHCRPTEALKPLIVAAVQEELADLLRGWLRPEVEASGGRLALDSTVTALSWAIFGAALQWSQSSRETPAETAARELGTLLTEGLGPRPKTGVTTTFGGRSPRPSLSQKFGRQRPAAKTGLSAELLEGQPKVPGP